MPTSGTSAAGLCEATSTAYPGHAPILAQDAVDRGVDFVFAAGGDGTLNEVANALVGSETVLAPIPTGTANVFARELGMALPNPLSPNWLIPVYKSLSRGRIQRMDVGKCATGRHWLLWASAGFDGYVVHAVEPRSRQSKRWGKLGYFAEAIGSVFKFRSVAVHRHRRRQGRSRASTCSSTSATVACSSAASSISTGAASSTTACSKSCLFQGRDWSKLPLYAVDVTLDVHEDNPTSRSCRRATSPWRRIDRFPITWTANRQATTPFACQIVPRALRVLVPETTPDGLFTNRAKPLPC